MSEEVMFTCYDPRTGRSVPTNNPALIMGQFIESAYRDGLSNYLPNWENIAKMADHCDELVLSPITPATNEWPRLEAVLEVEGEVEIEVRCKNDPETCGCYSHRHSRMEQRRESSEKISHYDDENGEWVKA